MKPGTRDQVARETERETEGDALAGGVDAALFLDDDVDLPSDDDEDVQ